MVFFRKRKHSIFSKFLLLISLVILVTEIINAIVHGVQGYHDKLQELQDIVNQVRDGQVPIIIDDLWVFDYQNVERQLQAITRFKYIEHAQISDFMGNVFEAGNPRKPHWSSQDMPLVYYYKSEHIAIGTLTLYIDLQFHRRTIFYATLFDLGYHLAMVFLLLIVVGLLFERLIARHIKSLSNFLVSDQPERFNVPFSYRNKKNSSDELDSLALAINQLRMNIYEGIEEKNLMMREFHHRIKNNMQMMSSILQLKESETEDKKVIAILKDMQTRMQGMNILYQKLYETHDANVSLSEYIMDLTGFIFGAYQAGSSVSRNLQIKDCKINEKILGMIGILLNELCVNSLKYAFVDQDDGCISIRIDCSNKSNLVFEYSDNGCGFDKRILETKANSLGWVLITAILHQLNADYTIETEPSFHLSCTFPFRDI